MNISNSEQTETSIFGEWYTVWAEPHLNYFIYNIIHVGYLERRHVIKTTALLGGKWFYPFYLRGKVLRLLSVVWFVRVVPVQ